MNYFTRHSLITSWLALMILALIMALWSGNKDNFQFFGMVILGFSAIKFFIVAFQFMDMKVAHSFWKIALMAYLSIFIFTIILLFK